MKTRGKLDALAAEIRRWQPAVNLVSGRSLAELEQRHLQDSLQLAELEPAARRWVDLGSGAGLPGLVVAAALPDCRVTLVESDSRKCAFLRHAAAVMGIEADIVEARIEAGALPKRADVVSARGLAALDRLLDYAQPLLRAGAVGLFPKGRGYATELTDATQRWHFHADVIDSRTDSAGRILRVSGFEGRRG